MKKIILIWILRTWILFLLLLNLSIDLEGQTTCGNISVSITTDPTTSVYDNSGSYTIHISGGPGTYIVSTENGETEDPDPIFCQIFGDCDPQPVIQHDYITLTPAHSIDSVRVEYYNKIYLYNNKSIPLE